MLLLERRVIIFLIGGLLYLPPSETQRSRRRHKPCDLPCPDIVIPPRCASEDFIVLDGEVCKSCDIDLCLVQEWPPKVAVPFCPSVICPEKHIPQKCVLRHFRRLNGFLCRDCDIDLCRDPPPPTTTPRPEAATSFDLTMNVPPLCPKLRCKMFDIPKECVLPVYDVINGQKCRKCDEDACRHPPALRIKAKKRANY